ncbi:MAG: MbnP family protein [Bacteroidota bacterium]
MRTHFRLLLFFTVAITIVACSDDEDDELISTACQDNEALNFDPSSNAPCSDCCVYDTVFANYTLRINHEVKTGPFSFDETYTDDFGHNYKFSSLKFYLSGIRFFNGTQLIESTEVLLVDPLEDFYDLGLIKGASKYQGINFLVGLEPDVNSTLPTDYLQGDPLSTQIPSMHWSPSSGYIFLRTEGVVDTNGDGTFDGNFEFQIGTNDLLTNITLVLPLEVDEEATVNADIFADYTRLMDDVDLTDQPFTFTSNNLPLAEKLAANLQRVFTAQ